MPWYKLTKGSIGLIVDGRTVDVEKGQTVELSEDQAKGFKHLKRVADQNPVNLESQPVTAHLQERVVDSLRDWSKSQDMKAVDVIAQVNETSSVEDLEALYDIEEKGQNRVTVLREIEKRVAQLEGEGK